MKVLHVVSSLNPEAGGVSQAVRTIIKGLYNGGVESEVATLDADNALYLQNEKFPVYALGPGKTSWQYSIAFFDWLKQNITNYDIVIIHGLWQFSGYATFVAFNGRIGKTPKLFLMPHGMLDPYFQREKTRRFKAFRNKIYWKLIENKIITKANKLLFTCEEERRLAQETFRPYKVQDEFVAGLGVEPPPKYEQTMREAFLAKCPEIKNDTYILFLGRLHEKKGVDILIESYTSFYYDLRPSNTLKDNCASIREFPKLVIAGPSVHSSFGIKMQQLVSKHPGLEKQILFPGMLANDSKWGAFYGCDAFILPSHQENFGIAVVEALACSKPVLISNKVNIYREILLCEAALVEEDTTSGSKQLLKRWLQLSEPEKVNMGIKAKDCFDRTYAADSVANKFLGAL